MSYRISYGILWKQYLIRFRLWILLFLAGAAAVRAITALYPPEEEVSGIRVGVCAEDEKGRLLLERLSSEQSVFRFLGYDEEQEMLRQIENGTLECGYLLPEGFYEKILSGKTAKQITLYYSPASTAHRLSYETVFSELFSELSGDILDLYLEENAVLPEQKEALSERLHELDRQYRENGSTFHFVYEKTDGSQTEKPEPLDVLRGVMGVLIFFMSLLGLGNSLEQESVWKAAPGGLSRRLRQGSIHVAVLGSVLLGGICLLIIRRAPDWKREMLGLLLYLVVLEIYVRFLRLFARSSRAVYGMIPVLLMGSCLLAPVFIRMESYIPAVKWLGSFFPVTWYLKFFAG